MTLGQSNCGNVLKSHHDWSGLTILCFTEVPGHTGISKNKYAHIPWHIQETDNANNEHLNLVPYIEHTILLYMR